MTLLNRPIGIWAIAIYSLYGIVGAAMNMFAVASASTVVKNIGVDYFVSGGVQILLGIALTVTVLTLRKSAVNIAAAVFVVSVLIYILPGIRLINSGVPVGELLATLLIIAGFTLVLNGGIIWYLHRLAKYGVLR